VVDVEGAEHLEDVEDSREEVMTEALIAAVILLGEAIEAATGAEHEGIRHIKSFEVIKLGCTVIRANGSVKQAALGSAQERLLSLLRNCISTL
jgi:hypothetical protein